MANKGNGSGQNETRKRAEKARASGAKKERAGAKKTQSGNFVIKVFGAVLVVNIAALAFLAWVVLNRSQETAGDATPPPWFPPTYTESPTTTPIPTIEPGATIDERRAAMIEVVEVDVIYNNIFINGVAVGGLSKEDALDKLTELIQKPFERLTIIYTNGNTSEPHLFSDFGARYELEAAVDKAYDFARTGSLEERYEKIAAISRHEYMVTAAITFDENKLNEVAEQVAARFDVAHVNPVIRLNAGKFEFFDGKSGLKTDVDKLTRESAVYLSAGGEGVVTVALSDDEPDYTIGDLRSKATSLIGTFTTKFSGSLAENRNINIRVAADYIYGMVVLPGEVFSTNDAFGPSTEARGYKYAGSYLAGEIVQSVGGGMCQTSSTLYMALLYSEVEIVERSNHSMPVQYVLGGMDATLSEGSIDLRFRNDTDLPIIIETIVVQGSLTVNIYGHETRSANRTIDFESRRLTTTEPPEPKKTDDPSLPLGEERIDLTARPGGQFELYKNIYVDGVLKSTVRINRSTYKPQQGKVSVGTGPAKTPAPTASPTPTPKPAATPSPTPAPTIEPTVEPTVEPTIEPTTEPTQEQPTEAPISTDDGGVTQTEAPPAFETEMPVIDG